MRVVHLLGDGRGALGRYAVSLAGRMIALGWEVVVAGPAAANQRFAFTADGAGFVALDIPEPDEIMAAPGRIAAIVRDARIVTAGADIVHAHGVVAALVAVSTGRPDGRPLVVTWPGAHSTGAIWGAMCRVVARRSSVILTSSSAAMDEVRRLGARDARLATLDGPPLPPAVSTVDQVREELGLGRDVPLLLAVGALVPERAYDVLLDAMARLVLRQPPPVLVIAGEGPERDRLAERIRLEQLPVRLIGRWPQPSDLVAAADVAVLACGSSAGVEGARPMIAREALRAGRPLVAIAVPGLVELVGEAVLTVPPGDGEALAMAVSRVLDEPVLAKRLSSAGVAQAATWPDEDDATAQVLAVYDELLRA